MKGRRAFWWGMILLYLAGIVLATLRPEFGAAYMERWLRRLFPGLPVHAAGDLAFWLRRFAHLAGYWFLGFSFFQGLAPPKQRPSPRQLRYAFLGAVGLALGTAFFDEWLQGFSRYRCSRAADIALDLVGIVLGAGLACYRTVRRRA